VFQINSVRQRLSSATDTRLAVIIGAAVDLKAQLGELNELRERVSKELPAARLAREKTRWRRPAGFLLPIHP
jgi:hypothetical protein